MAETAHLIYAGTDEAVRIVRLSDGTKYALVLADQGTNIHYQIFEDTSGGGDGSAWTERDNANHPVEAYTLARVEVLVDGNDDIHIVALDDDSKAGGVVEAVFDTGTNTFNDSGAFTLLAAWEAEETGAYRTISAAYDHNGYMHIAWCEEFKDMGDIAHNIFYANNVGGSWNTTVKVDGTATSVRYSSSKKALCVDGSGVPYIVGTDEALTNLYAYYGNANNATSFTSSNIASNTNGTYHCIVHDGSNAFVTHETSLNYLRVLKQSSNWTDAWTTYTSSHNVACRAPVLLPTGTDVLEAIYDTATDIWHDTLDSGSFAGAVSACTSNPTDHSVDINWAYNYGNEDSAQIDIAFIDDDDNDSYYVEYPLDAGTTYNPAEAINAVTNTPNAILNAESNPAEQIDSVTNTPDASANLTWNPAAIINAVSNTPDAAIGNSINPAGSLDAVTNTPDAILNSILNPAESADSITNTPDATLNSTVNPAAALATATNTPDASLPGTYNPAEALEAITNTPDVTLNSVYNPSEGFAVYDNEADKSQSFAFLSIDEISQSFTGNGELISSVRFLVNKTGNPTDNLTSYIYAHSGTFGTSSVPTGAALATSSPYDPKNIPSSGDVWIELKFPTPYQTTSGTKYCITLATNHGSGNYVGVWADSTSPTHEGNGAYYISSWEPEFDLDFLFDISHPLASVTNTPDATLNSTLNPAESLNTVTNTPDAILNLESNPVESLDAVTNTPDANLIVGGAINPAGQIDAITNTPNASLPLTTNPAESIDTATNTPDATLNSTLNPVESVDVITNTPDVTLNSTSNPAESLNSITNTPDAILNSTINPAESIDAVTNTPNAILNLETNPTESLDTVTNTPDANLIIGGAHNPSEQIDAVTNTPNAILNLETNPAESLNAETNTPDASASLTWNPSESLDSISNAPDASLALTWNPAESIDVETNAPNAAIGSGINPAESLDSVTNTPNAILGNINNPAGSLNAVSNTPNASIISTINPVESLDSISNTPNASLPLTTNPSESLDSVTNTPDANLVVAGTLIYIDLSGVPAIASSSASWAGVTESPTAVATSSAEVTPIFAVAFDNGGVEFNYFSISASTITGFTGEGSLNTSFIWDAQGEGSVQFVGEATLPLPNITVEGTGGTGHAGYGYLNIPRLALSGAGLSGDAGSASLSLPQPTVVGNNTDNAGTGTVSLPQPTASGNGISGATGTASLTLPDLELYGAGPGAIPGAGEGQGTGAVTIPSITLVASGVAGFLGTGSVTLPKLKVSGGYDAAQDGYGTGALTLPLFVVSGEGGVEATGVGQLTFPTIIVEGFGEADQIQDALYNVLTATMNVELYGVSIYQNYGMNSYANLKDSYYGCDSNGIYLLSTSTDEGVPIRGSIQKLDIDFDTALFKRVTDAFLHLHSDGDYTFSTIADGRVRNLSVSDNGTGIHAKKVNLPRGLKGHGIGFGLSSTEGSDIMLDEVELVVEVLSRRK